MCVVKKIKFARGAYWGPPTDFLRDNLQKKKKKKITCCFVLSFAFCATIVPGITFTITIGYYKQKYLVQN